MLQGVLFQSSNAAETIPLISLPTLAAITYLNLAFKRRTFFLLLAFLSAVKLFLSGVPTLSNELLTVLKIIPNDLSDSDIWDT